MITVIKVKLMFVLIYNDRVVLESVSLSYIAKMAEVLR